MWNKLIRQGHRWLSLLFAAIVATLFAILGSGGKPAAWAYFLPLAPLAPLALLTASGLWLFVLPYAISYRARAVSRR